MTEPPYIPSPDSAAKTVERLLQRIGELPPMPAVAEKALALIRNPSSSMADLADVLAMIQSLTMAASLSAFIDRPVPGYALERSELWKHSVGVASGVRLVAAKFGKALAEDAYHAGPRPQPRWPLMGDPL